MQGKTFENTLREFLFELLKLNDAEFKKMEEVYKNIELPDFEKQYLLYVYNTVKDYKRSK